MHANLTEWSSTVLLGCLRNIVILHVVCMCVCDVICLERSTGLACSHLSLPIVIPGRDIRT